MQHRYLCVQWLWRLVDTNTAMYAFMTIWSGIIDDFEIARMFIIVNT